jgi:hypothetical protein
MDEREQSTKDHWTESKMGSQIDDDPRDRIDWLKNIGIDCTAPLRRVEGLDGYIPTPKHEQQMLLLSIDVTLKDILKELKMK